jgi:hypothetical protein
VREVEISSTYHITRSFLQLLNAVTRAASGCSYRRHLFHHTPLSKPINCLNAAREAATLKSLCARSSPLSISRLHNSVSRRMRSIPSARRAGSSSSITTPHSYLRKYRETNESRGAWTRQEVGAEGGDDLSTPPKWLSLNNYA